MNQYKDQITRSINLAIEALTTKPELKNEAKKQLKAAQMLINNYWNGEQHIKVGQVFLDFHGNEYEYLGKNSGKYIGKPINQRVTCNKDFVAIFDQIFAVPN